MSRIIAIACLAGAMLVAAQSSPADALHEACYADDAGNMYRIYVDATQTTYTRTLSGGSPQSFTYEMLEMPAPGATSWEQGKKFGNKAQNKGLFPVADGKVKSASWTRNANTRVDTFTFTTQHEVEVVFTSARCPGWANCPFRGGYPKHCWDGLETCCGYNTMFASCIPNDSGSHCCTHYLAARACNATQTCCGMLGPGASSYAFCCNEGSTCCQARSSYSGSASCCPTGTTCCAGASMGLCCGADETCDVLGSRCVTSTNAPAVPEPSTPEPSAP
jgi:hypothetical protein